LPVYRYRASSVSAASLAKAVPGALTVGSTGPGSFVDVTADAGSKTDLDDYMASIGWAYVATDPTTTVFNEFATWDVNGIPANPAAGKLRLFVYSQCVMVITASSGSSVHALGLGTTISGNASTPSLSNTNLMSGMRRTRFTTSTSANSQSGVRSSSQLVWRGDTAGSGGFYYAARFGYSTQITGQRGFVGLFADSNSPGNIDYSTMIDMIGVGYDAGDTYLQLMHNDNDGGAIKIDLGAGFPKDTSTVYDFRLYAAPNASSIDYFIENMNTGATQSGSITTDLPRNTEFLGMYAYLNNNATALAAQLEVMRQYLECDY
jgi:hypothetical protein